MGSLGSRWPGLGAAEQAGGSEAGALTLGPSVLEEDGSTSRSGTSECGADHAWFQRAQLRGAAAGRRGN